MKTIKQILPVVIAFILICVVFGVLSPSFFTVNNITNVIIQAAINAVLAAGMTFIIITAGIDLSVGSVLAFTGIVLGFALHSGMPMGLALIICLIAGGGCGLINGLLITKGKLPPFIVTLGMMSIARGAALMLNNGSAVSGFSDSFRFIANGSIIGIPMFIIITAIVYALGFILLRKTPFGRYVYAIGGNEEAARLSGIKTKKVLVWVYVIGGLMAGLAAIMLTARINSAQPTAGNTYELLAIAAVVIGGTSLMGGYGFIAGTIVGALIISVINNGLNLLNVSSFLQQVIIGLVIILAVLIDSFRSGKSKIIPRKFIRKYFIPIVIIIIFVFGGLIYIGVKQSEKAKRPKIAFIFKTLNNPYFINMEKGAREAIKKYPQYDLIVQAPEREIDVEKQMQYVENMIIQKVKAICLTPSASKAILPAIKRANEAGIPVIIIDSDVDRDLAKKMGVKIVTFIGSDNYNGGELAAEYIKKILHGVGQVAVVEGMPGAATNEQRKNGFLDTVKKYPGIKVVAVQPANYERNMAYTVAQNILQANPKLNAIFAVSDYMALGAMSAIQEAGKSKQVKLVGFDFLDEAKKALLDGNMSGDVAQYPTLMGEEGIDSAIKAIKGEKVPELQYTKLEVITKKKIEAETDSK
ncbi:MAG TPA: substrate-binding domain-containing protein [Victivallales bacterium]|nr:substrate-binding domain-containing protein [Victivallales bacterium]